MAAIAMERTWHIDDSRFVPMQANATDTARHILWMMVQALKGMFMPAAPVQWTVVESCDGVQVAEEDLWTDATKIVRAAEGTAHSWIVLFNGAIYLTIDCSGLDEGRLINLKLSLGRPGTASGGSTIRAPWGTHETEVFSSSWLTNFFDTTNRAWRLHARMDEYGGFWIGISSANVDRIRSWVAVMKLAGAPPDDAYPWALTAQALTSGRGGMSFEKIAATLYAWVSRTPDLAESVQLVACGGTLGASSTYVLKNIDHNPADGTYPRYAIPMVSSKTNYRHARGYLPDWYWGPSEFPHGSLMPAVPDPAQFVLFGDAWLPGAVPPIW